MRKILLLILLWCVVLFGHFYLVPNAKIPFLIALADPFVHGLIAFTLVLPFYLFGKIDVKLLLLLTFVAVFIDVDHAVAAKSFEPKAMISLAARPATHSLWFALLVGGVAYLVKWCFKKIPYSGVFLFYLFFLSLCSHILRDATDTSITPWLYPFDAFQIQEKYYFAICIGTTIFHVFWAKKNTFQKVE